MTLTPRATWVVRIAIASCSLVVSVRVTRGDGQAAPQPQASATVAPQTTPQAPPPAWQQPAPPRMRIIHPQISQSALVREYRPLPRHHDSAAAAANEERVRAALDREVEQAKWRFSEMPLRDVVAHVRDELQVPLGIDARALENAGIDVDMPVTFHADPATARSALRRILEPIDLTWTIRDECLLITTKEQAAENLVTRLYPLPFGYATDSHEVDLQPLIDVIQHACGDIGAWQDFGGMGVIRPMEEPRGLVVSQTEDVHDQVEGLLRTLHDRKLAEFGASGDGVNPGTPVVRLHPVADAKVRADLAATLADLCNGSLPHGADPKATVKAVGECLAVQSVSPEFHVLAGQLIRGVAGVEVPDRRGQIPASIGGAGFASPL